MRYFEIEPQLETKHGWILGEIHGINEDDLWDLSSTKKLIAIPANILVEVDTPGDLIDYNLVYPEIVIISSMLKDIFSTCKVQLLPITVLAGGYTYNEFYIFKPLLEIDCVDENSSKFRKWRANNKIRPDLVGEYEEISTLKLDKAKVGLEDVFKIKKYLVSTIVSEKIKNKLEESNATGIYFKEV